MSTPWRFDRDELFDEDYLFFYDSILTDEISDLQADLIWRLLDLEPGAAVLDLACGHGRIANRLASKGADVTGLDATPMFLDVARRDAQERGVDVDYQLGDMRSLPWQAQFDAVTLVFTAFGYFDDDENRAVLEQIRRALKPGGRLWADINHLPWLFANFRADHVVEHDGQFMIDRTHFEPLIGRLNAQRTVLREGRRRTFEFSIRAFMFTELRDWLLRAGFSEVAAYSGRGEALTAEEPRMVVVARA